MNNQLSIYDLPQLIGRLFWINAAFGVNTQTVFYNSLIVLVRVGNYSDYVAAKNAQLPRVLLGSNSTHKHQLYFYFLTAYVG